jgi:hypothetical protein
MAARPAVVAAAAVAVAVTTMVVVAAWAGPAAVQGKPRDRPNFSLASCSAYVSEKAMTPFFCTSTK